MPSSLQELAMYRTFGRSVDPHYRKLEWAKMHDRGLSSGDRKRIVMATGHVPVPPGVSPRIARRLNGGQPKPKAQQTVASVRRNLSVGREMSRDFLTLACYNAIATGQVNILKAIYKIGKAPQVDKNGNTPLHVAAKCGQLRSLRWLLQHSSIPLLAKNARGETCLHVTALQGHLKCLQTIILCKKEKPNIIVSERDNLGMTALHHATIGNRERLVLWLVQEFGKDVCLVKSCDGVLAIHLAAAAGNRQCSEILAQTCKASVNMSDVFGATPVFYAAQEGHLECLQYFVENMEGSLKIVAFEGMTSFISAAEGGYLHVMKYLLDKQGPEALLATTNDGATVFHYVASIGNAHVLQHLLEIENIEELLRVSDAYDRTAAHNAAEVGAVECLRLLVEAGMSLYLPDKDGETPLSLAMRSANPKCVLFARAIADSTMDMTSMKLLKKKLGSKFNQISGIVTVQALSRDAAACFKRERKQGLSSKKKMGQYESSHAEYSELLAMKQGAQMWPSWHRSLASRRSPRAGNRGIFRGEFILLRSSPPGTCAGRERMRKGNPQNGYLYAQRNRPCPISLPLQKHEYPTRIHQIEAEDVLDIDDMDRFNHRSPLGLIQEYNGFRQGSRESSLDDIQEEDEEFDGMSIYSRKLGSRSIGKNSIYEEAETVFSSSMVDLARELGDSPGLTRIDEARKHDCPMTPEEDYSADESGISAHSDSEDKTGYTPSSSDESHHKKKSWSGSSDSAMRDSDGSSSMCSDTEVTSTVAQLPVPKHTNAPNVVSSDDMSDDANGGSKNSAPDSDDTGLFSISEHTDGHGSDGASRDVLPRFSLPGLDSRSLKSLDASSGHARKWSSTSSSDDEGGMSLPTGYRYKSRINQSLQNPKPSTSAIDDDHLYSEITIISDADESDAEDHDIIVKSLKKPLEMPKRAPARGLSVQEHKQSTGSLADIMKQSLTGGFFTRTGKTVQPKKTCNPVFDSSSIKKDRQAAAERRQSIASKRMIHSSDDDTSPYDSSDDSRSSSENSKPKCGMKIKALQDILIKQSLPFANPAFFMVSSPKKEPSSQPSSPVQTKSPASLKDTGSKSVQPIVRHVPPGSVPPPPPPPPPPSTLPKAQKQEPRAASARPPSHIKRRVSEKAYSKSKEQDDRCFDDETKTRIKSIKTMLQRASSVKSNDSVVRTLPR